MLVQAFRARIERDAAPGIVRRAGRCWLMERAQKPAQRRDKALQVSARHVERGLPAEPWHHGPRPWKARASTADSNRRRNGQWQPRCDLRQPALLVPDQGRGQRTPRETDREVGVLFEEEGVDERCIDDLRIDDFGI